MNDYLHIMSSRLTGNASRVAWLLASLYGTRKFRTPQSHRHLAHWIADALQFSQESVKKSLKELERGQFVEIEYYDNGASKSVRIIGWDEYQEIQDVYAEFNSNAHG